MSWSRPCSRLSGGSGMSAGSWASPKAVPTGEPAPTPDVQGETETRPMSSMPWSIGPSTHRVSRLSPRRHVMACDRPPHVAAVADSAEGTGGDVALGRAHEEIADLKARLAVEQIHCREALEHGSDFDDMVGRTPGMLRLHDQIAQ